MTFLYQGWTAFYPGVIPEKHDLQKEDIPGPTLLVATLLDGSIIPLKEITSSLQYVCHSYNGHSVQLRTLSTALNIRQKSVGGL